MTFTPGQAVEIHTVAGWVAAVVVYVTPASFGFPILYHVRCPESPGLTAVFADSLRPADDGADGPVVVSGADRPAAAR